jgi:hypothetical protein
MSTEVEHLRVTYNDSERSPVTNKFDLNFILWLTTVHNLIRNSTPKIAKDFNPDLLVAIGGGSVVAVSTGRA